MPRLILIINILVFFLMPLSSHGKDESLSCRILELILRDKEKENIVKKTYSYRDSTDKVTGELYRKITNVTIDTIPLKLRLKRNQILILDDFVFFEAGNCSEVSVINKGEIADSFRKDKKLYVVSGISTYRDYLVVTILNFSEGSKSSYFFSIKNEDVILVERKDRSN